jgi:hypothetical protein
MDGKEINPEHKESAEEMYDRLVKEFGHPLKRAHVTQIMEEYAQLAVKEAREQDIKEMEEMKKNNDDGEEVWDHGFDCAIDEYISIVKSKLEGGE